MAYNNLGNISYSNGNFDEAARLYIKALKALPDFPEAHNGLGAVLLRKSKIRLAIEHFKKASELDPSNPNFIKNYKIAKNLISSKNK